MTEGGSDGAARSTLAYLAVLYKIAPRSVLIRAVPEKEYGNQCVFHIVLAFAREFRKMPLS